MAGLTLVEIFAGREDEGGGMLSAAWEAAGGTAIRYDQRIDDRQDFMLDDQFWKDNLPDSWLCWIWDIDNYIKGV